MFEKGKFEIVEIGGMNRPRDLRAGVEVSEHVARIGARSCQVEHVGMVVSGSATAAMDEAA